MKIITILVLSLAFTASYACEVKNKAYNFNYSYDESSHIFQYMIEKKDKTNFKIFHKLEEDVASGFILYENKTKEPLKNTLSNFYYDNGYFFTRWHVFTGLNPARGYPLLESHFKVIKKLEGKIDIKSYVSFLHELRPEHRWDLGWGNQQIKFKVKVILDKDISQCLNFETKEYKYYFGTPLELF